MTDDRTKERVRSSRRSVLTGVEAPATAARCPDRLPATSVGRIAITAAEARFVIGALPQILERGANPDSVEAAIALARDFLVRSETPND